MARIPRFQIQRLADLDVHNPGVDQAPMKVGESLLQNTGALARTLGEADARFRASAAEVQNAVVHGILNMAYNRAAQAQFNRMQQQKLSNMNADTIAAQTKTQTANAVRDAAKQGASQPTLNMQQAYTYNHDDIVEQAVQKHYRSPDGKTPVDEAGEKRFRLLMEENKTSNLNAVGHDQDKRDTAAAAANYFTAKTAIIEQAKNVSSNPDQKRTLLQLFDNTDDHDGQPPLLRAAAQAAFGPKADKQLSDLARTIAVNGLHGMIEIDRETSLAQAKGNIVDALAIENKQLNLAKSLSYEPKLKEHMTTSDIETFDRDVAGMINANNKQSNQAVNVTLTNKMFQASVAGLKGIDDARNGDVVSATAQAQQLGSDLQKLGATPNPTPRMLQLFGHLETQQNHVYAAIDQVATHKRQMSAEYARALKAKQTEIYMSQDSNDMRTRLDTALKNLPPLGKVMGSPEDYAAINEARAAAEDAAKKGAIGFGSTASAKLDAYYGHINAVLQKSNMINSRGKSAMFGAGSNPLEKLQDAWSATFSQIKPAPDAVQNALNPTHNAHLHNLINDQWTTALVNQVSAAKANPNNAKIPGFLDSSGNVSAAAITNTITNTIMPKFINSFKAVYAAPVDAAGKLINAFKPPPMMNVSGQVLNAVNNPPSPESQAKGAWHVPAPPNNDPGVEGEGGTLGPGTTALAVPDIPTVTPSASEDSSSINALPSVPESAAPDTNEPAEPSSQPSEEP